MDASTTPLFGAEDLARESVAFPRLSAEELADARSCGCTETYPAGHGLIEVGQRPVDCFIIVRGRVAVIDTSRGRERLVVVHGAGAIIGDINALAGRPAVATCRCTEETEAIRLCAADVRRLLVLSGSLSEKWIAAFLRRRELLLASGFEGLRLFGPGTDRATLHLSEFLHRNGVAHHWLNTHRPEDLALLPPAVDPGTLRFPVVAWGDHLVLQNPTLPELARQVGVQRDIPAGVFDTVIIGSGPAGLGAAVYAASEGLATLVLDRFGPGGQAGSSSRIENYAGFPAGLSGQELALRSYLQALKFGAMFSAPVDVRELRCAEGGLHEIVTDDGTVVRTRTVIIATGVTYRSLGVRGMDTFQGTGVYWAATQVEALLCQDRPVHVVGAGNSAGQAAMFLSKFSPEVNLVVRGGSLQKSMSSYLSERVEANGRIRVRLHTEARAVAGGECLETLTLENTATGERTTEASGGMFVFIGASPCTDFLGGGIGRDDKGFVLAGAQAAASGAWKLARPPGALETTCPGIFVAGDCRSRTTKRVAFAVGDGALAVTCVHDLLGTYA